MNVFSKNRNSGNIGFPPPPLRGTSPVNRGGLGVVTRPISFSPACGGSGAKRRGGDALETKYVL